MFVRPVRIMPVDVRLVSSLEDLLTAVKDRIPVSEIHKYLRYAIKIKAGEEFNHIINDSIFDIDLEKRTIVEGEAFCGRYDSKYASRAYTNLDTCPGCIAIARSIAVRDVIG